MQNLILIELWLKEVYPLMMKSLIQSSIVICNEVILLSCIEEILNHKMILMHAEEFLPEVIEYCYRRILILESFCGTEEAEHQKNENFICGFKAIAIISGLIEHKCILSDYIYLKIVRSLDIPMKMIKLMCDPLCKIWIEDQDAQLFKNKGIQSSKRKMSEIEKKLLSFLTDDVIQQLPKLKNLAQFIEVTKNFGASKIKLDFFIYKGPILFRKLKEDNRNKWTNLARQQFVHNCTVTEAELMEFFIKLSDYIYLKIVRSLDIPMKMIKLMCDPLCKIWIEDQDAQLFKNKGIQSSKRKMSEIEKKMWNVIYSVLLSGKYAITELRKPNILKLLSFLTDDVIQQLPKLKNLAQFIEVTKNFGASKIKLDFFIYKGPILFRKLKEDNRNKWTNLARQQFVHNCTVTEAELMEFFIKLQHLVPPSLNYEMEKALQLINSQGSLSQENILNVLPPQPTPVATQRCVISAETLSEALQAVIKGGKRKGGNILTEEFVKKLKRKHEDEVNKYNEEIKKLKEKLYLKVATALLMREEGPSEPLRKKIKLEEKKLLYIVLDTNILVHNLHLVRLLLQDGIKVDDRSPILCLSVVVIKELDKLKTIKETEDRARTASDFIARRMQSNDKVVKQHYTELLFVDTVVKISNDEKILVWSIKLKKRTQGDDEVIVLTNDKNMSLLIRMADIPAKTAKELMIMLKDAAGVPVFQSSTSSNQQNQKKKK